MDTRSVFATRGIIVFSLLVSLCRVSTAVTPTEGTRQAGPPTITFSEPGRSFALRPGATDVPAANRVAEWEQFKKAHGAEWTVDWNSLTGTASFLSGGGIATGLSAKSADKEIESWARRFAGENRDLLGVGSDDLRLLNVSRIDGRVFMAFQQVHGGLPVYGAALKMHVNPAGDLVKVSSTCFPAITLKPDAKLSREEAARAAAALIASGDGKAAAAPKFAIKSAEQVIFPMPAASVERFRLCWLLMIHLSEPLGDWVSVVDAATGVDYVRYNNYRFGSVTGTVTGKYLPAYYDDTPAVGPMQGEDVHVFSAAAVLSWSMDVNPGWTAQGLWTWGTPNGQGGNGGDQAPTGGHTGSNVYGYNLTGGYENSLPSPRWLRTSAINCTGLTGVHLSFWQWVGVEDSYYDELALQVSNDGTSWTTLWHNPGSTKRSYGWERMVYDISSIADGRATVYIRWGVGPTDSSVTYCGWYLDDVEIYAGGGTATVSNTGNYSVGFSGTIEAIYSELSGPYADVRYEDGPRMAFNRLTLGGPNDWSWDIPPRTLVVAWNLDMNPGWTVQGQWAFGVPLGLQGDPSSGHTGTHVYGYNLSGAYANNLAFRYLITPALNCSTLHGTTLRFWRWLGVDYWDYATIEVSNDNSHWARVYENMDYPATRDTAWKQVTYDISAVADGRPAVYIRWGIWSDASITYCGWNIDDIEILGDSSVSDFRPGVYDYDELNVFHHMNAAHNYMKQVDPSFTGMDYKAPGFVRVGMNYANAYWDGEGLNFGEGDGAELRNLALFSDVIYHEYQHGVTDHIYPSGMLPYVGESGAMDEAWSDYFACDLTGEPLIGERLMILEPWMRNLDNGLRVPDDWYGEVHYDGRIMAGALWDLRQLLGSATATHLIHAARFAHAEAFQDYYEDVLAVDDNNSNLSDGTPHMDAIARAFGLHGIGALQIRNIQQNATRVAWRNGKLDAAETGDLLVKLHSYFMPHNVRAQLSTTDPSITILHNFYNYGNFAYGQEKTSGGGGLRLRISPTCPVDRVMDLKFVLTADGGFYSSRTLPLINAPDQLLYDEGVPAGYFGYGQAGGGFAVRMTPLVYPATLSAMRLYSRRTSSTVTVDLHVWDDDGPSGTPGSELIIPRTVTISGRGGWEEFPLAYRVAYSWNLDSDPGWSREGFWAFGRPMGRGGDHGNPDPTAGATGLNVFGYNLYGGYSNDMHTTYSLRTSAINCSNLRGVTLQFMRWLGVEGSHYDHATIDVSNNGTTWVRIWENPYSTEMSDTAWTRVTYDISAVADNKPTVYIRWGMGTTDYAWTWCGWNIDDIQILTQTGATPGVVVTSGDVYLGWTETGTTYYNGVTKRDPDRRSWVKDTSRGWLRLDSFGYIMDLMVRARLTGLGVTEANPSWTLYR
jgi:Zn-dependent metalloprotease